MEFPFYMSKLPVLEQRIIEKIRQPTPNRMYVESLCIE